MIDIQLQWLPHGKGLTAPTYATDGAAGLDVLSAENVALAPGQRHAVSTGFAIAIPEGYEVQVRPRSGLALKHGITCLNTPGTIDADYRGEVKVILVNHGPEDFTIRRTIGPKTGEIHGTDPHPPPPARTARRHLRFAVERGGA